MSNHKQEECEILIRRVSSLLAANIQKNDTLDDLQEWLEDAAFILERKPKKAKEVLETKLYFVARRATHLYFRTSKLSDGPSGFADFAMNTLKCIFPEYHEPESSDRRSLEKCLVELSKIPAVFAEDENIWVKYCGPEAGEDESAE